jgi:hypothetical protein
MKIYWSVRYNDYVFDKVFSKSSNSYYFFVSNLGWVEVWHEYVKNLELVVEV